MWDAAVCVCLVLSLTVQVLCVHPVQEVLRSALLQCLCAVHVPRPSDKAFGNQAEELAGLVNACHILVVQNSLPRTCHNSVPVSVMSSWFSGHQYVFIENKNAKIMQESKLQSCASLALFLCFQFASFCLFSVPFHIEHVSRQPQCQQQCAVPAPGAYPVPSHCHPI